MIELNRQRLRHLRQLFRQGPNPAAVVYESIRDGFPFAPAPGWLNLGLWNGAGEEEEAPEAARRLVETLAGSLPKGGVVLDVGNGLGLQDPVISGIARPTRLVVLNITEAQLRAGRPFLAEAGAHPVTGDAVRIPLATGSVDGIISVESAFHFGSRPAFFAEARRVLRPGGALAMSDLTAERGPGGPLEWLAGLSLLRFWGLRRSALVPWRHVAEQARAAGLVDVEVEVVGDRVFDPVFALTRRRLRSLPDLPFSVQVLGRMVLALWSMLWHRGMMQYVLLRGRVPEQSRVA